MEKGYLSNENGGIINSKPTVAVSPFGLAFESSSGPDNPYDFNIIRARREAHCRYKGASFEKWVKVPTLHQYPRERRWVGFGEDPPASVTGAPTPSKPAPTPATIELPGVSQRGELSGSQLIYLSAASAIFALGVRFYKSIREFDLGTLLDGKLGTGIAKFLDSIFGTLLRKESDIIKIISNILWKDHNRCFWAPDSPNSPWAIRVMSVFYF